MDLFWIILLITALTGVLGWSTSLFTNLVWWWCEWREGNEINWGSDVAYSFFVPLAFIFPIVEIILMYSK